VPPPTSACLLVTHSPNAGVSYSVHGMLRIFDAVIVMQMVICHSHGWEKSPLSSQISPDQGIAVHVAVTTGPRELTETLPPTRNATAQPGSSWPRRREAFLPLAKSYRMKGMPRANLHCRGRRGRHCREDCDSATARRRQRAEIMLVSRAVRCHPEE
jgi:hypothetical protein